MSKFAKLLIVLAIAIGVGVAVARLNEVKQKFLAMTEEEQRQYIRDKLAEKVPEDRLEEIENAVLSAISGKAGL